MRLFKIGIILAFSLCLTGCWNYQEPDEIGWVTAVGLDRGRENVLTVSFQIAVAGNIAGGVPGDGGGGASGAGQPTLVISVEAPTLLSAVELADAWIERRIVLSHVKVVVMGRELAEQDFGLYMTPLLRFRELRPTIRVAVANGRAEELLREATPLLEASPGKYWELLFGGWQYTEFIPRGDFHKVHIDSTYPGAAAVPPLLGLQRESEGFPSRRATDKGVHMAGTIPRRDGPPVEAMGVAVIKDGRMVGVLNGGETGLVKMVQGTFRQSTISVPDPLHRERFVILQLFPRELPEIEVRIGEDGLPRVAVRVLLEGDILSIQSGEHYEQPDRVPLIERAVEAELRRDARAVLDKAQNEFGADVLALGYHAKRLFPTWPAWEEYNWEEKFPQAEISIDYDFQVRRVGVIRETNPDR